MCVCVCVCVCVHTQLGCEVTGCVLGWGFPSKYLRSCSPTLQLWCPCWASHTSLCSSLPGAAQTWMSSSASLWKSCYHSRWQGHGPPFILALAPTPGALNHRLPRPHPHSHLSLQFPPPSLLSGWFCCLGQMGIPSQAYHSFLLIKLDLHLLFAGAWGFPARP